MMEQRDTAFILTGIVILGLLMFELLAWVTLGAKPIPAELMARPRYHMIAAAKAAVHAAKGDRLDRATFDERFDAAPHSPQETAATAISELT